MPMWDALQQLGWTAERVSLYLDCTGIGPTRRGGFGGACDRVDGQAVPGAEPGAGQAQHSRAGSLQRCQPRPRPYTPLLQHHGRRVTQSNRLAGTGATIKVASVTATGRAVLGVTIQRIDFRHTFTPLVCAVASDSVAMTIQRVDFQRALYFCSVL